MAAALAVPLTLATRLVPRKRLLLMTTSCFVVSNLVSALAPSFAILAVGRAFGGAAHALFFSVCIGYATRLVPAAQTGRALALMSAGVSAGFVLGVPLATALGNAVGWRGAFAALATLMVPGPGADQREAASRQRTGPATLAPRPAAAASWAPFSARTPCSTWGTTRSTRT